MNKLNDEAKPHGYWVHRWHNDQLYARGHYNNGMWHLFWERFDIDGVLITKEFFL